MSFNKEPKQATTEMATSTQQTKGLKSKGIAVHVRYKSVLFLCRPPHNNNVSSAYFGERKRRRLILRIFIWN